MLRALLLLLMLLVAAPAAADPIIYVTGPIAGDFANLGLYHLDPLTGSPSLIGPTGFGREALPIAIDRASGLLWGVTFDAGNNAMLVTIDPATGAAQVQASADDVPIPGDLTFAQDGRLFAARGVSGTMMTSVFEISLIDGTFSLSTFALGTGGASGILTADNGNLIFSSFGGLYDGDLSTGLSPLLVNMTNLPDLCRVRFNGNLDSLPGSGVAYGVLSFGSPMNCGFAGTSGPLVTVSLEPGTLGLVNELGDPGITVLGLVVVPEPGTLLLISLSLVALGLRSRGRRPA